MNITISKIKVGILSCILSGVLMGQIPTNQLKLTAPAPTGVTVAGAHQTGNSGINTYFYWVVSDFPIGKVQPQVPASIVNAQSPSTSNIVVGWNNNGASTWDVIRTTLPIFPGSCTGCLVASGIAGTTTVTDTGSVLGDYVYTGVAQPYESITVLNNLSYANATVVNNTMWLFPGVCFPDGSCFTTATSGTCPTCTTAPNAIQTNHIVAGNANDRSIKDSGVDYTTLVTSTIVQNNLVYCSDSASSGTAYTCNLSPALPSYAIGQQFLFRPNTTNTGASTLTINGHGGVALVDIEGSALNAGVLLNTGYYVVAYTGTNFKVLSGFYGFGSTGTGKIVRQVNPVITTPFVADLTNMNHDHSATSAGGQLTSNAFGNSSKQGTGTKFLMASTVAAGSGNSLCTDATGGATTTGCPSGGGGASNTSQLLDFNVSLAGNTVTINGGCTALKPCVARRGNHSYSFTSSATITKSSGSNSDVVYVGIDSVGALVAGGNSANVYTGSGVSIVTGQPSYDVGWIPLWALALTTGTFDPISETEDARSFISAGKNIVVVAGANVTVSTTETDDTKTFTVASTGGGGGGGNVNSAGTLASGNIVVGAGGTDVSDSGITATGVATKAGIQASGGFIVCVGGGTATVATCSLTPALTAYTTHMLVLFLPVASNTGALTLNIDGLGAKAIKLSNGSTDPAAGGVSQDAPIWLEYDGTSFRTLPLAGYASSGTGTTYLRQTNPTITTPTIADLTNSNHNHTNAAGGGQLTNNSILSANKVGNGTTFQMGGTISAVSGVLVCTDSNQNTTTNNCEVKGSVALGTSAISSGTCATVVTAVASGIDGSRNLVWTANTDITAVTGYAPVTTGRLEIYSWPSSNQVNFKVCNPTGASITPGAVTLNWWAH